MSDSFDLALDEDKLLLLDLDEVNPQLSDVDDLLLDLDDDDDDDLINSNRPLSENVSNIDSTSQSTSRSTPIVADVIVSPVVGNKEASSKTPLHLEGNPPTASRLITLKKEIKQQRKARIRHVIQEDKPNLKKKKRRQKRKKKGSIPPTPSLSDSEKPLPLFYNSQKPTPLFSNSKEAMPLVGNAVQPKPLFDNFKRIVTSSQYERIVSTRGEDSDLFTNNSPQYSSSNNDMTRYASDIRTRDHYQHHHYSLGGNPLSNRDRYIKDISTNRIDKSYTPSLFSYESDLRYCNPHSKFTHKNTSLIHNPYKFVKYQPTSRSTPPSTLPNVHSNYNTKFIDKSTTQNQSTDSPSVKLYMSLGQATPLFYRSQLNDNSPTTTSRSLFSRNRILTTPTKFNLGHLKCA